MSNSKPLEPLNQAKKVKCSKVAKPLSPTGNIAAIDFGTTSVSIAYITKGGEEIQTYLFGTERHARVPNAILLKKEEGSKITVFDFGVTAHATFAKSRDSNLIFFERIKMLIKREKNINRQTLVESFSGEKFYLVEVIAFILKHLKGLLITHLAFRPSKTTEFDWVITVPAIWDARGKSMMKEAAYLAGLLPESDGITHFTRLSYERSSCFVANINSDRLSLALEPESAALYSQDIVSKEIEKAGSAAAIERPTDYMTIDIGGGTVDITAHEEVPGGGINVVNVPTGNAWGGTQVNEAFSKMLQEIVGDPNFENFLSSCNYSLATSTLNKILYREFEEQKVSLGQGRIKSNEIAIDLGGKFANYYDNALEVGVKRMSGVSFDNDTLYIEKHVVESKLFGPTLDGIISCTLDALKESGCKADTFYLVGGFGGCKYVHEKVTPAIEKLYQSKGKRCYVVVPKSSELAVATGAVMWRKSPDKIKRRCADATYGIKVSDPFDGRKHDEHYRYRDKDEGRNRCHSIFKVFLLKGEAISSDEVITTDLMPINSKNEKMFIKIYTTPNLGVQYVVDKEDKETVEEIGQLIIDIPNPDGLPFQQRKSRYYNGFQWYGNTS